MKKLMLKLEEILDQISTKQNIACLAVSGAALLLSLLDRRFDLFALNFNIAWVAIILCGVPIILEAVIGLVIFITFHTPQEHEIHEVGVFWFALLCPLPGATIDAQ